MLYNCIHTTREAKRLRPKLANIARPDFKTKPTNSKSSVGEGLCKHEDLAWSLDLTFRQKPGKVTHTHKSSAGHRSPGLASQSSLPAQLKVSSL